MKNKIFLLCFLMLSACGGTDNLKIDTDAVKNSPLIVPPIQD